MNNFKKITALALTGVLIFSFAGCSAFEIKEQPDTVIITADKIYPNQVGNFVTDRTVNIPSIKAFMDNYNKNAESDAKINYTAIKYNSTSDYYYVNDSTTSVGVKFHLNDQDEIASASIYSGILTDNSGKNLSNVVINAIKTSGYKSLMTQSDKDLIAKTVANYNSMEQSVANVQSIFNGQANFSACWSGDIAEFEIPVKPDELPKCDTSHELSVYSVEQHKIPDITIDTSIIEGTKIAAGQSTSKYAPLAAVSTEDVSKAVTNAVQAVDFCNSVASGDLSKYTDEEIAELSNTATATKNYLDLVSETTDLIEEATTGTVTSAKPDSYDKIVNMIKNPSTSSTVQFKSVSELKQGVSTLYSQLDKVTQSINDSQLSRNVNSNITSGYDGSALMIGANKGNKKNALETINNVKSTLPSVVFDDGSKPEDGPKKPNMPTAPAIDASVIDKINNKTVSSNAMSDAATHYNDLNSNAYKNMLKEKYEEEKRQNENSTEKSYVWRDAYNKVVGECGGSVHGGSGGSFGGGGSSGGTR